MNVFSCTVPLIFKHSLITNTIKKHSLDHSYINNYRPISNLSILYKTLEKVISKQLPSFLTTNNIRCTFQNYYVPIKYTETVITRVTTHILCNLNNTYGTILFYLILAQHLIQLTIVFSYDWLILVSPVMHLNGLRHTFLAVLLLFL